MKQEPQKKCKNRGTVQEILSLYDRMEHNPTDPQGSYTGRPEGRSETPVQDADDL